MYSLQTASYLTCIAVECVLLIGGQDGERAWDALGTEGPCGYAYRL